MQETYTVTVQTADGKCLIQKKITGDLHSLYSQLSVLSLAYTSVLEDLENSVTLPGFGIGPSVSECCLPTGCSCAETS